MRTAQSADNVKIAPAKQKIDSSASFQWRGKTGGIGDKMKFSNDLNTTMELCLMLNGVLALS